MNAQSATTTGLPLATVCACYRGASQSELSLRVGEWRCTRMSRREAVPDLASAPNRCSPAWRQGRRCNEPRLAGSAHYPSSRSSSRNASNPAMCTVSASRASGGEPAIAARVPVRSLAMRGEAATRPRRYRLPREGGGLRVYVIANVTRVRSRSSGPRALRTELTAYTRSEHPCQMDECVLSATEGTPMIDIRVCACRFADVG